MKALRYDREDIRYLLTLSAALTGGMIVFFITYHTVPLLTPDRPLAFLLACAFSTVTVAGIRQLTESVRTRDPQTNSEERI